MRSVALHGKTGFTLLEMSLVLTVIALLMGGIMIGQSMIRASQVQRVVSEVAQYTQAASDFRGKYRALPGDFAGAEALWGTASGGCPDGVGTGTQTCNGNGNGFIEGDCGASSEDRRAWQQLAIAGFISGQYTGVPGPLSAWESIPGTNIPASAVPSGGYEWFSSGGWRVMGGCLAFSAYFFDPYTNGAQFLKLGARKPGDNAENPLLTAVEAFLLDTKMDDGQPGTGIMTATKPSGGWNPNCATTSNASTAKYNTGYSQAACLLIFRMQ